MVEGNDGGGGWELERKGFCGVAEGNDGGGVKAGGDGVMAR